MAKSFDEILRPYLIPEIELYNSGAIPSVDIGDFTEGMAANAKYFGHPEWAADYFKYVHRTEYFRSRWLAATGPWDGKVVVDVGCGPGNVFATVGGKPKVLIGVDIAEGGLEMAVKLGYVPLRADAHNLPLKDGIADIVVLNAALHHFDDMYRALGEAARLVKPGGILVADHDPQMSAWDFRGLALLAWRMRLHIYLMLKKGYHRSVEEQLTALISEIHHDAGKGLKREMFLDVLRPKGFDVELFPHNHKVGAEALQGVRGRSSRKYRVAQLLSGRNPDTDCCALSLLCRARRRADTRTLDSQAYTGS
jgi:ubiquinone/menaquinone biosynthesis C-methylase UbiE